MTTEQYIVLCENCLNYILCQPWTENYEDIGQDRVVLCPVTHTNSRQMLQDVLLSTLDHRTDTSHYYYLSPRRPHHTLSLKTQGSQVRIFGILHQPISFRFYFKFGNWEIAVGATRITIYVLFHASYKTVNLRYIFAFDLVYQVCSFYVT